CLAAPATGQWDRVRGGMRAMSRIYLPSNASAARLREAEHARRNRAEIVRELSWGRVTRRDLIKMGLFTGADFFPGQFYDYHWPIVLGGGLSMNKGATESKASSPTGDCTLMHVPGDWQETISPH